MIGNRIKPYGRLVNWLLGSLYDFSRFARFGGWKINKNNRDERNYYSAKVYHSLEKSLSFKNRNSKSGWGNAVLVLEVLRIAKERYINYGEELGFHDLQAFNVLSLFVETNKAHLIEPEMSYFLDAFKEIEVFYENFEIEPCNLLGGYGVLNISKTEITESVVGVQDDFFLKRFSIRAFSEEKINRSDLINSINLSLKTPSACNRQPWHVYHVSNKQLVQDILRYQSGNRGFSKYINELLIVCSDLRAFNPGSERYQHWIDGGMYSMSLVYTLRKHGIESCCLNWSHQGGHDIKFRNKFSFIENPHTIMMILAVGYPEEDNTVCYSPRRPLKEILTEIE